MHRQSTPEFQLDPKIERTFRRLLRENQGFVELGRLVAMLGGNEEREECKEGPKNRYIIVQPPNIIGIANDRDRSIRDYVIFDPETMNTGIVRPEMTSNHFKIQAHNVPNATNSWAIQWAASRRSASSFEAILRSGQQFQNSRGN